MNLSGESVQPFAAFFKLNPSEILVIHDELDIPFGQVHFKMGGGLAGHNGLKSIDMFLSTNYHRIRIGIDKPKTDISNYVLGCFDKSEYLVITQSFSQVIEIITKLLQ
jgi:PTH1 family peptidyl-tRNA hydrolase